MSNKNKLKATLLETIALENESIVLNIENKSTSNKFKYTRLQLRN